MMLTQTRECNRFRGDFCGLFPELAAHSLSWNDRVSICRR